MSPVPVAGTLVEEAERLAVEAAAPSWAPYPEYRESGADWLGRVPFHWQAKRLKHAVDLINEKIEDANGLPYIGLEHIESWTGRRIESETPVSPDGFACRFGMGDVLFGKLRPYLAKVHLAEEPGVCTAEALVLRPKFVRADYLRYYVLARQFIEVVDGSTYGSKMPRANWQFIGCLPCLVPAAPEQRAIAAFLDRKTRQIGELIEKKRRLIEMLQEKRTALISHAVTKGLDPNAQMKPSGVEWFGDVPQHWGVVPLMYRTEFGHRVMYGIVLPGPHVEGGVPIVKGGDVTPNRLRRELLRCTDPDIEAGYKRSRLRAGDLVYAIRGSIGACELVPPDCAGVNITQDTAKIAPHPTINRRWLLYVMKSSGIFAQLESGALGATIRGINIRDLKRCRIPIPPTIEQEQIATHLDEVTKSLDAFIDEVAGGIDRLQEYRQALIFAAVTGKIDVREEAKA